MSNNLTEIGNTNKLTTVCSNYSIFQKIVPTYTHKDISIKTRALTKPELPEIVEVYIFNLLNSI